MKPDEPARPRRETLYISGANVVVVGLGALTSILVARALGPEGRGDYVTWQVWSLTLASIGSLGLPQAVVTLQLLPKRVTPRAIAPAVLSSVLLGTAAALLALVVLKAPHAALLAGGLLATSTSLNGVLAGLAQRAGALGAEFNLIRLGPPIAGFAAVVFNLSTLSPNPATLLASVGGAQCAFAVLMIAVVEYRYRRVPRQPWRLLLRESLAMAPIAWVTLLQYRADLLLVSLLFSSSSTAFYAIGASSQAAVFAAGQSTGMQWFGRGRTMSVRGALRSTVLICGVAALPFVLFPGPLVRLLYGEGFAPAAGPTAILALGALPQSFDYLLTHAAMIRRRHSFAVGIKFLTLGLLAGAVLFARHIGFGVTGTALLVLAATSMSVIPLALILRKASLSK